MKPIDEVLVVVDSEGLYCWAVQTDDGALILMDRDMRIVENTPWQHPGMGLSGLEETLEEHVDGWLEREWWRTHPEEAEKLRQSIVSRDLPDF